MNGFKRTAAVCCESGAVRQNNEDNFYFNGLLKPVEQVNQDFVADTEFQGKGLFAVFDGMGGESYGELASSVAASVLHEYSQKILEQEQKYTQQYIRAANKRVCLEADKRRASIGTTLVMAIVLDNHLKIYSLGDSRAYLLRRGELDRLTEDHIYFESEQNSLANKRSNRLSQFFGIPEELFIMEPHFTEIKLFPRDKVLLCSDGLTDMLTDYAIKCILATDMPPKAIARELVDAASIEGGKDNVTALVII
jgi:protein phosphatase